MLKRIFRSSKAQRLKPATELPKPIPLSTNFTVQDKAGRVFSGLIQDGQNLIAEVSYNGKQVAQVKALFWMEFFDFSWELQEFRVDKGYRRQGLGTALGKYLLEHAAKTEAEYIWVDLGVPNPAKVAFVQKMGFNVKESEPANSYWEYQLKKGP